MSLILNIDTASEKAHVSFAKDGIVMQAIHSESQKEHASFLQTAIQQLSKDTGTSLQEIDAVAVTAGPGSYTGLRVGMASAKGLCYALQKPLITISSLEVLAGSALELFPAETQGRLLCPMLDARRMEVFTALYNRDLSLYSAACAMILDENSFGSELSTNKILFFGNGSDKWKMVCKHPNAEFQTVIILPESMSKQTGILYKESKFTDLVYSEPLYLKEFQTVIQNRK